MTKIQKLSVSEVEGLLASLNQQSSLKWALKSDKLHIELVFPSFQNAMAFMQEVAIVADKMDHHPEWCNVYNRVQIDLITHSVSGLSSLDFELARQMSQIFTRLSSSD